MSELRQILELWKRARAAGEEICLATIAGIEGSAYRRPGARMLLTASGQRAGTISGGCLEAEVVKKAWWLTASGPAVQRYSSFFDDDGEMPYGLGCGGTVIVTLERGDSATHTLAALERSVARRTPSVIVNGFAPNTAGTRLIVDHEGHALFPSSPSPFLAQARQVLEGRQSVSLPDLYLEYLAPPPALFLYGAGDDAQPLVSMAASLGWHITVADGRSHLARPERFPEAAQVAVLGAAPFAPEPGSAAVVMTHSYEQDRQLLLVLLEQPLAYLGLLGPRRRTDRLVAEVAPRLGLSADECLARLHAPVGLDLGGHSPATIALSIAAEIQAVFAGRDARRLTPVQPAHV